MMIALAIVAVASAAVIPALVNRVRTANTSALAQTFFNLSQAIFEYRKAVTAYPPTLDKLSTQPLTTTTDACGTTQIGSNANSWRGPYITRDVLTSGVNIGDATIQNSLRRVTSGSSVYLLIDVAAVDQRVAADLEATFDNTTDITSGTIRYTTSAISYTSGSITSNIPAAPGGTVNLSYAMPITGC